MGIICNFGLNCLSSLAEFGRILEDLELDFKVFSLLIMVVHTLSVKIPSDATLASLSISIYPRWRPRWKPIIYK